MERMDLTGKKFGRLTVVGEGTPFTKGQAVTHAWICKCDCGKVVKVRQGSLTRGSTKSCGCLFEERSRTLTAFGESRTVSRWSALTGIPCNVIRGRITRGWPPEKAVTAPVRKRRKKDDES